MLMLMHMRNTTSIITREALKSDPVATLRDAYQFIVPAGISLQVVEGDEAQAAPRENTLRMVIPPTPDMDMREVAVVGTAGESKERRAKFTFSATFC
jgi:hypothetical protein